LKTNKITLGWPNRIDQAVVSGGSWLATLPLTNVQDRVFARKARSTGITLAETRMQIDLDKGRPIGVVAIAAHNFAPDATVRVRYYTDYAGTVLVYDSGAVPAYPAFFQFEQLEWEDNAFWLGTNTLDPLVDYTALTVIFADQVYLDVRRIDIDIDDQLNPNAFIEIGRVLIANTFQPELNASYGMTFGHQNETTTESALDGTEYFDRRRQRRTTEFVFENVRTADAFQSLYALQRDMGVDREVLFAYETQDSVEFYYRTFIGRLQRLNDLSHPYANRWDVPLAIQEIL
jgi:hypothetical protein